MSNNVAIVTVRNSSTRLPHKPFIKIKDELRAIDIIIERAKKTKLPVILATSTHKDDDVFSEVAKEHGIRIFRGSLLNKIKRWYDCFKEFQIDNALLVDGDDLSYDFKIGSRAIIELELSNAEMIINPKNIVCGFFTYAINKNGIEKLKSVAPLESTDTDVITRYIEKANLKTSYVTLEKNETNKDFRLTLDYNEDLEFYRKLYSEIDALEEGQNIVKFLENNKSISQINIHRQKDFLNNQAKFNEKIK